MEESRKESLSLCMPLLMKATGLRGRSSIPACLLRSVCLVEISSIQKKKYERRWMAQ